MNPRRVLVLLAAASVCIYLAISALSPYFEFGSLESQRPIPLVLFLFAAAFIIYLMAICLAVRADEDRQLLKITFVGALAFRVVMLPSMPIQEVDIYRYLWDGAVSSAGVNPFRFSPKQVREASPEAPLDGSLKRLVELRDQNPNLAIILSRIHYGDVPTVYPPVSQAVFAAATFTTPSSASVWLRLVIIKSWFVAFDLATLFLVVKLLQLARMPIGLCLIYGWCPLLIKEFANSGHLDAVAVFLTTFAVYLSACVVFGGNRTPAFTPIWSGVVLAMAVGAKLFPVILAPLIFASYVRHIGWRIASSAGIAFGATTLFLLWPMLPVNQPAHSEIAQSAELDLAGPPIPRPVTEANDPSRGIQTFLRYWEMNDFIFLLAVENLKPIRELPPGKVAWFSIVPDSFRVKLATAVSSWLKVDTGEVPFLASRAITALMFLILGVWLVVRAGGSLAVDDWLYKVFLTLAWFWLLCPTQNPWYWTWALPFLAFARNRAWLAMSGLVMLYYLRFWLSYHWPTTQVLGTGYVGREFFDFIVTWIEFAPWFVWLSIDYCRYRKAGSIDGSVSKTLAAQIS